jgi:bifunctional DNA-binding transcriptional regulator/antitoxin component of YhaV-PrlF toxin-antitoxin module
MASIDEADFYTRVMRSGEGKGSTYRLTIPKYIVEVMGLEKGEMLHVKIKRLVSLERRGRRSVERRNL